MISTIPALSTAERIKKSPNYRKGVFHNIHPTPVILEGVSFFTMLREYFTKPRSSRPSHEIPIKRTDLKDYAGDVPQITWFGHSSYLIQYKNLNILVDPVFAKYASPVPFFVPVFKGADYYTSAHMPRIDILLLSHNHYDHLDKATVEKLRDKVKQVLCPLGVGQHLLDWGYKKEQITEFDWWEQLPFNEEITITATSARHFTGRGSKRNETLWCSYALRCGSYNLFLGGDSGYDDQFKKIGKEIGPFDIAILENGQYGKHWPYIHMMPEEVVQAAADLNSKLLLPVHWGKYALSGHPWTEPIERLLKAAQVLNFPVCTPMIGETFILGKTYPARKWWME